MPSDEQPTEQPPLTTQQLTDIVEVLVGWKATADGQIRELAGAVAELLATPNPDAVRPWLTEDDAELGVDRLELLARWLREVWVHYPGHEGGRALPPCWARHPWVVEELWAARGAYRECTGPRGSYQRFADWLDRTRPAVARRLSERLGTCDVHRHADGRAPEDLAANLDVDTHDLEPIARLWTGSRDVLPDTPKTTL